MKNSQIKSRNRNPFCAPFAYYARGNCLKPKSSPNERERQQRPRKIRRFKNHANIEDRGNREIREIRETRYLFVYFAYFAVKKVFLGEDLGSSISVAKRDLEAYFPLS